jgi:hypothetical protein
LKQEGYVLLINQTDYDWILIRNLKINMKNFCFPGRIKRQTEAVAYVEWEETAAVGSQNLAAAVCYQLEHTDSSFIVLAYEDHESKDLRVYFENMASKNITERETKSLGWINGGTLRLILSEPGEGELHRLDISSDYGEVAKAKNYIKGFEQAERVNNIITPEAVEQTSVNWFGKFKGIGTLDNLYLRASCFWEECVITLQGAKDCNLIFTLTLIVGGELVKDSLLKDIYLYSDQIKILRIPVGKMTTVVLAGTVKSNTTNEVSVDVTLTGICKKNM